MAPSICSTLWPASVNHRVDVLLFHLQKRDAAFRGPVDVAEFLQIVAVAAVGGDVVDQNDACRAVHFGVRRLSGKLGMLGEAAGEYALLIVFLRFVP